MIKGKSKFLKGARLEKTSYAVKMLFIDLCLVKVLTIENMEKKN